MSTPIQPQDHELLSAYLDDELPDSARAALEARLDAEPTLRLVLEDLRHTVQIVRSAPQVIPPRNFTLDPARYGRRAPWWTRYNTMRLIGAAGAFASIVLILLGVFSMSMNLAAPASLPGAVAAVPTQQTGLDKTDGATNQLAAAPASATGTTTQLPLPTQVPPTLPLTATQLPPTPTAIRMTASPAASVTRIAVLPTATLAPTTQARAVTTLRPTASATVIAPAAIATNAKAAAPSAGGAAVPSQPTSAAAANAAETGLTEPTADVLKGEATATDEQKDQTVQSAADNSQFPMTAVPTSSPQPPLMATPLLENGPSEQASSTAISTASGFTFATTPVPTDTAVPSTTSVLTATFIPGAVSVAASATRDQAIAQAPTAAPTLTQRGAGSRQPINVGSQLLVIIGIALLIFSGMLYAIGWMRSRL